MENKKDDNGYNNESYLNKRVKPDDLQNIGVLDEIGNKTEEKSTNSSEKSAEIKPIKNIDDSKLEDDQKEMHPEIVRKKNKDFTKPLILGIIVLIIIGMVAAYFLMPLINIQKKETPQQIIKSSMQEMQKVKTYSYDGIMEFDIETKEGLESFDFDVELSGKADQTDVENIKAFNNIKIASDVDDDQRFSVDLDTVQIGQKKTYLKLNDFDFGVTGMIMGPQISPLKEKWYELDLEELEKLSATSTGDVSDTSMVNSMTTYDMNKIMELYNKYELLKFEEDLGDTKLGNIDTLHYKVKLDGIALANFYVDIMKEIMAEMDTAEKGEILTEEFDGVLKEIEESVKKYDYVINEITNNVNVEIWIGRNDKLIHRTKINGIFDVQELKKTIGNKMVAKGDLNEERLFEKTGDDIEISFYIDISMRDFNQPVEINEPEEAENLVEVLEGMFGGFLGTGATGTEIDTDKDGLPDYMENLYGTDLNNPDTDGDGYKDGEEVESGYDPLLSGNARLDYDKLFNTQ